MTGTQELTNSIAHMIGIILSYGSNTSPTKKIIRKRNQQQEQQLKQKKNVWVRSFPGGDREYLLYSSPGPGGVASPSIHAMAPTGGKCVSSVRDKVSYPSTQRHDPRQL